MAAINGLRDKFGGSSLFGNEKDESFQGSLAAIYQTFGGEDLYRSVEEKVAHLLYFVKKTTPLVMVTKELPRFYLYGSLKKINCCIRKMAPVGLLIIPWLRLR